MESNIAETQNITPDDVTSSNVEENPYLSMIMTSRKDDYGGNAIRRVPVPLPM